LEHLVAKHINLNSHNCIAMAAEGALSSIVANTCSTNFYRFCQHWQKKGAASSPCDVCVSLELHSRSIASNFCPSVSHLFAAAAAAAAAAAGCLLLLAAALIIAAATYQLWCNFPGREEQATREGRQFKATWCCILDDCSPKPSGLERPTYFWFEV